MSFQAILRRFLQSTPRAIGAIFIDHEGESVDFWTERVFDIGPHGLRVIGAYQGIFRAQLRKLCEEMDAGRPLRLKMDFETTKVLTCDLKDGYYLVLVLETTTNEGLAWQRLEACRHRLLAEI